MNVLELFSGTECLSEAFRRRGHECFTVDWDLRFPSSMHIDIMELTAGMVLERFGRPDPQFRPACKNGDPCHVKAPRGTKLGLQAIKDKATRAKYPPLLCEHIVDICEGFLAEKRETRRQ